MPRRIAHISDLHFGRVDAEVVEPALRALAALRPDVVAVTGDLTQRARRSQFEEARSFLERLEAPAVVVPGNHDIPLYDVARRMLAPLARYRRSIAKDVEPTWIDDELVLLGVNSARSLAFKGGAVSRAQLDRVSEACRQAPASAFKAVLLHHPLVTAEGVDPHDAARGAGRALEALRECRADAVLSGHLHRSSSRSTAEVHRDEAHAVLLVQAGSALSTRLRGEANSFNVVDVAGDFVAVTIHAWDPASRAFVAGEPLRYEKRGEWRRAAPIVKDAAHG